MTNLLRIIFALSCLLNLNACATRSIYIKSGAPVQLAEDVYAKVWVPDKDGIKVKTKHKLSEGFWVIEDTRK